LAFTSINFAWFVLSVFVSCQLVPRRYRWIPLLAGSYAFYLTWQWLGAIFLVTQTLCAYLAARFIESSRGPSRRHAGLLLGLFPVLGMLLVVKYTCFVALAATELLHSVGIHIQPPTFDLFLPGISFFTFAHGGYLIDVFKGRVAAERHLGRFALFGCFFPQVISGPIPRADLLLPQLQEPLPPDDARLQSGAVQVLWGLFKKIVVADRLASYVNPIFANVHAVNGATLALAVYFFTFQIYCDFSGYTDIAIGTARLLGIDLAVNFRRPYFSRSVGEFWHRWHISLSSWFRDYLYIPLGGSRVTIPQWVFNILVVFLISGLWHGAAWTFLIWGGLHGIYLVAERLTDALRSRAWTAARVLWLRPVVSTIITFHLVTIAWIFFRAATFSDAIFVIRSLPTCLNGHLWQGESQVTTLISVLVIGLLLLVEAFQGLLQSDITVFQAIWRPLPVRWSAYIGLVLLILLLSVSSSGFIYGKF